jgi:hypothetical protein
VYPGRVEIGRFGVEIASPLIKRPSLPDVNPPLLIPSHTTPQKAEADSRTRSPAHPTDLPPAPGVGKRMSLSCTDVRIGKYSLLPLVGPWLFAHGRGEMAERREDAWTVEGSLSFLSCACDHHAASRPRPRPPKRWMFVAVTCPADTRPERCGLRRQSGEFEMKYCSWDIWELGTFATS